jgi:hypothetical protein
MRTNLKRFGQRLLKLLRLWPLSLAEKCRITFGAAVVFILVLALLVPYVWMVQLTKKGLLDTNKEKAETLLYRWHFQPASVAGTTLPPLDNTGTVLDVNDPEIRWIRFAKNGESGLAQLTDEFKEVIESLITEEDRDEWMLLKKSEGLLQSNYVRIFRATDSCVSCHNPQRSGTAFSRNEPVGAVIIRRPAGEISVTRLLNLVWIIAAGLIAGVGAIVAFYMITQRVILRPIRQLNPPAHTTTQSDCK